MCLDNQFHFMKSCNLTLYFGITGVSSQSIPFDEQMPRLSKKFVNKVQSPYFPGIKHVLYIFHVK